MKSPASILFDISGIPTAVSASAQPTSGALGQVMAGFDATNSVRYASFDGASLRVSGSVGQAGNWSVLQSGVWSVTASGDIGVLKQDATSRELIVTGSTIVVRGNDGAADRNLLTDNTGKLQVSIASGSAGIVSVLTGSQIASLQDRALVVHISPNQQPIPTSLVPETATPGSSVGRASGLSANTLVAVRQTTYVEQTTQAQRSIVSTNANDSAAGTGARTVMITYYDASVNGPFTETITMNGTTAVNTVNTDICFIESIMVLTVGSNGSNVGTLNLYTGTGATGTIFAAVGLGAIATGVGDNQTFYAHHYVPTGKVLRGYIVTAGIIAAAGGGSSVTVIRYRNPTSTTSPWQVISDFINAAQGNSLVRPYSVSIELPGPAVVAAFATPANNNSTASCSFDWSESDS